MKSKGIEYMPTSWQSIKQKIKIRDKVKAFFRNVKNNKESKCLGSIELKNWK